VAVKNKVILGTVKLGLPAYGFSSASERLPANKLLENVHALGIDQLDTSPRYGESEKCIGDFHRNQSSIRFNVSTKIDNLAQRDSRSGDRIRISFESSLEKLNIEKVETLYLHQSELEIISDVTIMKSLSLLKEEGLVSRLGVSVYSQEEFLFALQSGLYNTIQFPINVFDSSYYFEIIETLPVTELERVRFVGRSIILQGLLLNEVDRTRFLEISQYKDKLEDLAREQGVGLLELSHSFLNKLDKVDKFIVGSTSLYNIANNLNAFNELDTEAFEVVKKMSKNAKKWANPRNWT